MFSRVIRSGLSVSLTAIALLGGAAASGESVQTIQTLDRVDVYNKTKVLEMEFDDPGRQEDFAVLGVTPATAAGFVACQVTASQALYCIDGKDVVYWAKPSQVAANTPGAPLFSCAALGLDGASPKPCTALTVDMAGAIWVAGRKVNGTYSLYKLVAKVGSCPASPWFALPGAAYCAKEYASGRRLITDITPIDGDVAAAFKGPGNVSGPGVIGLEQSPPQVSEDATLPPLPPLTTTALFFPDSNPSAPGVIATGSQQWTLAAGEELQSVTLQQLTIAGITRNFAMATTNQDRILAVDTLGNTPAFQVFDIVAERMPVPPAVTTSQCNFDPQRYGLRASNKSGRAYLTDRNYCQAVALETVVSGASFQLSNVQEVGSDLTFSTSAAYPPDANTIAAGIVVNLDSCGTDCVLLSYKDGTSAASLSNVKLVGSKSGMTLFQVKDIPDCRWAPDLCAGKNNVVIDSTGNPVSLPQVVPGVVNGPLNNAKALYLNVTPLLPVEITALFDPTSDTPPKGLPRMLISPQYRAQNERGFLFEALFGVTDDGVVFQGTFDLLFDVGKLLGNPAYKLGCGYDYSEAKKPNLDWDVITTVSEKVIAAGGPGLLTNTSNKNRYVDMMVNTGCINPTAGSGARWSMYPYNLEITPNKDDVFAQLLLKLFDDLDKTRADLACQPVDTTVANAAPPLSSKVCSALKTQWSATKTSLNRCYSAPIQPKSSASKERCNTFEVQLRAYQTILDGATTSGPDPANRLGELKSRVNVLFHVYRDRFLPSIPANGFTLR